MAVHLYLFLPCFDVTVVFGLIFNDELVIAQYFSVQIFT